MGETFEMITVRDLDALGETGAALVRQGILEAARADSPITVVLAGGSTPRKLYERLAAQSDAPGIPWARVHLFWGDERCVPPDHPESNYRMACDALIARVSIPSENVHRMAGEDPDPRKAAEDYERFLRRFFNLSKPDWPRFDLVLLGIGADGHAASLFPGSPALEEKERWVAAPYIDRLKAHRLTLTLPVFNHAARVIFLAAGMEKAAVIKAVNDAHSPDPGRVRYPVQRIRLLQGKRTLLRTRDAAGDENPSGRTPSEGSTA